MPRHHRASEPSIPRLQDCSLGAASPSRSSSTNVSKTYSGLTSLELVILRNRPFLSVPNVSSHQPVRQSLRPWGYAEPGHITHWKDQGLRLASLSQVPAHQVPPDPQGPTRPHQAPPGPTRPLQATAGPSRPLQAPPGPTRPCQMAPDPGRAQAAPAAELI